MKLNFRTQHLPIDPDKPFQYDAFGRQAFANKLENILKNTDGVSIFVHAPWGHGKSTFVKQWQLDLKKRTDAELIVFDAFQKDYLEEPLLLFISAIRKEVTRLIEDDKDLEETVIEKLQDGLKQSFKFGGRIAISTLKQQLRKVCGDVVDEIGHDATEEIVEKSIGKALDAAEVMASSKLKLLAEEENALVGFKTELKELAETYREANNGYPLTIVVDELDRCRPDFALKLLEAMKHFFDIEGVSFILFADKKQLAQHVSHSYGIATSDMGYLTKFGDVFCELPNSPLTRRTTRSTYGALVRQWSQFLLGDYNTSQIVDFNDILIELAASTGVSVRHLILIQKKGYLKMSSDDADSLCPYALVLFSYMSVEYPIYFNEAVKDPNSEGIAEKWISSTNLRDARGKKEGDQYTFLSLINKLFGTAPLEEDEFIVEGAMFSRGFSSGEDWFQHHKKRYLEQLREYERVIQLHAD